MSHQRINQFEAAAVLLDAAQKVTSTQTDDIAAAAALLAESVGKGGVVQVFGTGHSRSFAMEIAGRAGGLVPANKIAITDLAFFIGVDDHFEIWGPDQAREALADDPITLGMLAQHMKERAA